MNQSVNRNARCHCGSGKKFKNCHGAEVSSAPSRKFPLGYVILGVIVLAAAFIIYTNQAGGGSQQPGQAPPGKVWSVEHGHWHDQ
jgi:hypothetical protein